MRNIEIKAKINNLNEIEKKAKELSDLPLVIINQRDIFFNLPNTQANFTGRLKLREFQDGTGELIFYERQNIEGPKLSVYSKVDLDVQKNKELRHILTLANGVAGMVEKKRHLYLVGQTRIHIDQVLGLGNFIEFEVVLDDTEDPKIGEKKAKELMKDFGISENSLLSGAYFDMLNQ